MEQLDTDVKLMESSKDKKEKKTSSYTFLLIILCAIIGLGLIYYLFQGIKPKKVEVPPTNSK